MEAGYQSQLWSDSQKQLDYEQLCNALYQREIVSLAEQVKQGIQRIDKKLASLPFYVKRTAENLLSGNCPLTLDHNNASWQAKQPSHNPCRKVAQQTNQKYFEKHTQLVLVVPVTVNENGVEAVYLDCIDQIKQDKSGFHINQFGWFSFDGRPLEEQSAYVTRPTKTSLTPACCGHRWSGAKRLSPRVLSLRELLLVGKIKW